MVYSRNVGKLKTFLIPADMAELADAHGSGPCEGNFMEVQVLLSAPDQHNPNHIFPVEGWMGSDLLYTSLKGHT